MKEIFDKISKERRIMRGYLVLKWDARREEKGKHGKFDNLCLGPFEVIAVQDNNIYDLAQPMLKKKVWADVWARSSDNCKKA
jgi:hypothetical protein